MCHVILLALGHEAQRSSSKHNLNEIIQPALKFARSTNCTACTEFLAENSSCPS